MRTTKPISTISFNSPEFLALKLQELQDAQRISFWAFIVHKPEDDEAGKKYHQHVYVEPSKMIQTDDLRDALKEFDPTHPDKPLGCLKWHSSKFDDWYLYVLHDARYLASKGQSRRFHYVHDDIVSGDYDDLLCMSRNIDLLSLSPYAAMQEAIAHGLTFQEFFRRGTIPILQVKQWENAWYMLMDGTTNRNGREGHPSDLNEG